MNRYDALTTFQTMTVLSADLLWNNRNDSSDDTQYNSTYNL